MLPDISFRTSQNASSTGTRGALIANCIATEAKAQSAEAAVSTIKLMGPNSCE